MYAISQFYMYEPNTSNKVIVKYLNTNMFQTGFGSFTILKVDIELDELGNCNIAQL